MQDIKFWDKTALWVLIKINLLNFQWLSQQQKNLFANSLLSSSTKCYVSKLNKPFSQYLPVSTHLVSKFKTRSIDMFPKFTLLTFSWPCFPRSQHLGHSQLFGRSSFSIPSFDRSGYFWWRQDGWRIFQQMPHSISGDDSFPRLSPLPPAAEEQEVEASPFSQMTQTAAVGSIGWMWTIITRKQSFSLCLF